MSIARREYEVKFKGREEIFYAVGRLTENKSTEELTNLIQEIFDNLTTNQGTMLLRDLEKSNE